MMDVIKMLAYKHGDIPHCEWEAQLISLTNEYALIKGLAGRKLIHHTRNRVFEFDKPTIEIYPFNEWYVGCLSANENNALQYYFHICSPPTFSNNTLRYVDYDLDVVNNGQGWATVDKDELITNSGKYGYPPELFNTVLSKELDLYTKITQKQFPFDGWFLEQCDKYL